MVLWAGMDYGVRKIKQVRLIAFQHNEILFKGADMNCNSCHVTNVKRNDIK